MLERGHALFVVRLLSRDTPLLARAGRMFFLSLSGPLSDIRAYASPLACPVLAGAAVAGTAVAGTAVAGVALDGAVVAGVALARAPCPVHPMFHDARPQYLSLDNVRLNRSLSSSPPPPLLRWR